MSDSVRPHRWQPTRLPRPWDSPGKNTGLGCPFLLQFMKVKSESEVTLLCPTLSDPWTELSQLFWVPAMFQILLDTKDVQWTKEIKLPVFMSLTSLGEGADTIPSGIMCLSGASCGWGSLLDAGETNWIRKYLSLPKHEDPPSFQNLQ